MNKIKIEKILDQWPVKIVSFVAAMLIVFFYKLGTLDKKYINIPLNVRINDNLVAINNFPRTVSITLRGKKDKLFTIIDNDIKVQADLLGYAPGEYIVPIEVTKTDTALLVEPLEIKVNPISIKIKLDYKVKKTVQVFPNFKGFPAMGWDLERYFISPNEVEIEGPQSILDNMKTIKTEEIDLTDKTGELNMNIRLGYDRNNIKVSGDDQVNFFGVIKESVILHSYDDMPIQILNLKPSLEISDSLPYASIKITGNKLLLQKTDKELFRLFIDLGFVKEPGKYNVPVQIIVPNEFRADDVNPKSLEIIIIRKGQP